MQERATLVLAAALCSVPATSRFVAVGDGLQAVPEPVPEFGVP